MQERQIFWVAKITDALEQLYIEVDYDDTLMARIWLTLCKNPARRNSGAALHRYHHLCNAPPVLHYTGDGTIPFT